MGHELAAVATAPSSVTAMSREAAERRAVAGVSRCAPLRSGLVAQPLRGRDARLKDLIAAGAHAV